MHFILGKLFSIVEIDSGYLVNIKFIARRENIFVASVKRKVNKQRYLL